MKSLRLAPVVLAPLVLLACGQAGDTDGADTASMDAGTDTAAMADTAAQSGMITLEARNQSGISGTAHTERAMGDSTVVVLELEGLEEDSEYPAHVHSGSCADGGPVAVPLNPVTGGAEGSGTSRTTIDVTQFSDTLTYFVQAHQPGGQPAACANVPTEEPQEGEMSGDDGEMEGGTEGSGAGA